jgi:hypothetical protein
MSNIRSAMTILPEIRGGQLITEMSAAIHDAVASVKEHNKAATVMVKISIEPSSKEKLVEPFLIVRGSVESKLPKEEPEATVFFVDGDGNPTRDATKKQADIPFTVASSNQQQS